jgi:hypothetical protein
VEVAFKAFGKIPRLFRDITITEKIDGTNGAIGIEVYSATGLPFAEPPANAKLLRSDYGKVTTVIYAQSRSRIITPGKNDNHGFAGWVWDNAWDLLGALGPGLHYGEWWGSGINRGYGLKNDEKRFSLFNTKRWAKGMLGSDLPSFSVVPVLYEGPFSEWIIHQSLADLEDTGSAAAPGFMRPEGVIVYHHAGNNLFKATIHGDEAPKTATIGSLVAQDLRDGMQAIQDSSTEPLSEGSIYGTDFDIDP